MVLTFNEEANIERTLQGLSWAESIIIVDSGSTDRTLDILASDPRVFISSHQFDTFANQCNRGLKLVCTPWCLSLDADHFITPEFVREMSYILSISDAETDAILTPFRYVVYGKTLRGTLLPPRYNLVRPDGGYYIDDGHAHQFRPRRRTLSIRHPILHDDRKPLLRWLNSQQRYIQTECQKLLTTPYNQLSFPDRLRRKHVLAPFCVFLICLIYHRGVLDGWRGWFYAFQRLYTETLLSLMLWDARRAS